MNDKNRFSVILSRPQKMENIGRTARAMKNTGFRRLRLVGVEALDERAYIPAVHSRDILDSAEIFPNLDAALSDQNAVFAATAKPRKNFPSLSLFEAVEKMRALPPGCRIGLLFGNERTGLTSQELCRSNFRFRIPQSERQPSYNLATAVLLTLFQIFISVQEWKEALPSEIPLTAARQKNTVRLILSRLETVGFIHAGNRRHVTEMVHDIFGRMLITEKDRRLILALISSTARREG